MKDIKIALVGSGMICGGLAVNALMNDYPTIIYDVIDLDKVRATIQNVVQIMVDAGAMSEEKGKEVLANARYTNDLEEAVRDVDFVQECVPERIELKRSVYRQIQEIRGADVIIASSTSATMPSVLQEDALYPETILVGHPYNPSYLLPLIEICGGTKTSEENIQKAMEIYKGMGKVPVHCKKEVPGFIVNRLSWSAMDIAKETVMNGVCSVEDMDKAIMYGPGMRMAVTGQILVLDDTGKLLNTIDAVYNETPLHIDDMTFDANANMYLTHFAGDITNPVGGVYRLEAKDGYKTVTPVIENMVGPNGLSLSPDGTTLWVSESTRGTILRVGLNEEGFAEGRTPDSGVHPVYTCTGMNGPDSNKTDSNGNLYQVVFGTGRAVILNERGIPTHNLIIEGSEKGEMLFTTNLTIEPGTTNGYFVGGGKTGGWICKFDALSTGTLLYSHQ